MKDKGYRQISKRFLAKEFDSLTLNISQSNNYIEALTAYDVNDSVVEIPKSILMQVKKDIQQSLE